MIAGDGSNGALVPDSVADFVGVGPGDEIQLNGGPVLRVGGVYRALYKSPTVRVLVAVERADLPSMP